MQRIKAITGTKLAATIASICSTITICHSANSFAQATNDTQSSKPQLEEVLVTSQKRSQNLQDVPMSVAAVSAKELRDADVNKLDDLQILVPNIHMTETGIGTQVRIRGIGSGINQGFEQSVGYYVNGISWSRAQLFRVPLFDLERVEVMRGPQGTLFGKNSIAGAVDVITARPTDAFEAELSALYETQFKTKEVSAIVSGPIGDTVRARLSLRGSMDDGYILNETKNEYEPRVNDHTGRLSVEWDISNDTLLSYIGEQSVFDTAGRQIEITQDQAGAFGANYSQLSSHPSIGGTAFDSELNYKRQANTDEFSDNKITSHRLSVEHAWEYMTLTSITGQVGFNTVEQCDCDYTPSSVFELRLDESYDQFSQELRLNSNNDGRIEWLGGLFYQNYEQEFGDYFLVPQDSLLLSASAFIAQQTMNPALALHPAFAYSGVDRRFKGESDAWALFGEVSFNVTDALQLTLGGRFTEEEKRGEKILNLTNGDKSLIPPNSAANIGRLGILGLTYKSGFKIDAEQTRYAANIPGGEPLAGHTGHNTSDTRKESSFTPSAKLLFDISDDAMTYFSYSEGFKAGGFDPRTNSNVNFEFEEETAESYELGYKRTLADGRADLNIALYKTNYYDLQSSQFDGSVGFTVGNIAKTRIQGIELDGRWAIMNNLTFHYAAALLDFEYKDFENGNCNQEQTDNGEGVDINGDGIKQCSYTGKSGMFTPDLTFNLGLDFTQEISNFANYFASVDLQHVGEHNTHVNLSENGVIDAYNLLSARTGLQFSWSTVALVGKNLLNEDIISYSGNVPLSGSQFGSNTFYSFVRRPRTIALELSAHF